MLMTRTFLSLELGILLVTTACDKSERCVADCVETEPTASASFACVEANDAAKDFIDENRSCATMLDCVHVESVCYEGGSSSIPCGVTLSKDADFSQWDALYADVETDCQCQGSSSCGDQVMCSLENRCAPPLDAEEYCASLGRDINTFLGANKTCETDTDCMLLRGECFSESCSDVAVNTNTSPDDWARLDRALRECEFDDGVPTMAYCNLEGDCGATVRCSDQGQCVAG